MMSRRHLGQAAAAAALTLMVLASCKPTEKNYQQAYDKAAEAARRKASEMATASDGSRLESLDGPAIKIVDGDTIRVAPGRVRAFETENPAEGTGVAVAKYSMPTNARRQLQDIREAYPGAFIATDGDESYYVVATIAPSQEEAAPLARDFRNANPSWVYLGLDSSPILITVVP